MINRTSQTAKSLFIHENPEHCRATGMSSFLKESHMLKKSVFIYTEAVSGGVLENFAKFTVKHLFRVFSLKKGLWHRCFPMNFAKFSRAYFLQNTSGRLLLPISLKSCHTPLTTFLLPCLPNNVFLDVVLLNNIRLTLFDHNKNNPPLVYWQNTPWMQ